MHNAAQPASILIVEDHAPMRALLRDFLQDAFPGCTITETADGRGAMDAVATQRPQVVLMDIGLPDANGITLTARIIELLPSARVIMVTQNHGPAYMEPAFAAGAFGYVCKEKIHTELLPLVARAAQLAIGRPQ